MQPFGIFGDALDRRRAAVMSALCQSTKADKRGRGWHVCFVPEGTSAPAEIKRPPTEAAS
jgi:hypothetical protein